MNKDSMIPNMKVIIVGRSSVGKSSLLLRYTEDKFVNLTATIAVDYVFKQVEYQGQQFNL